MIWFIDIDIKLKRTVNDYACRHHYKTWGGEQFLHFISSPVFWSKKSLAIVIPLAFFCVVTKLKPLTKNCSKIFRWTLVHNVPRTNTHDYTKSHNSGFNNHSLMPLFRLCKKKQTSVGVRSMVLLSNIGFTSFLKCFLWFSKRNIVLNVVILNKYIIYGELLPTCRLVRCT